jgi:hypothetical protein
MKLLHLLLIVSICFFTKTGLSQSDGSYFGGKYKISTKNKNGNEYKLYDFSRSGGQIKAKYFATNAYKQYQQWKLGKEILLIMPGAFSTSFDPKKAKPVGLTVDNGVLINRNIDNIMDGMVIVYNGGGQQGGIAVVDLDEKAVKVQKRYGTGDYANYYPRTSSIDRDNFIKWGENQRVTLFQTQLVYSKDKSNNFSNLYSGKKRERRFLALCYKNSQLHHVVIDVPEYEYLNLAAKNTKEVLENDGFRVWYIMNFDTGGYDILHAYNGYYLEQIKTAKMSIKEATNLLIYYKD